MSATSLLAVDGALDRGLNSEQCRVTVWRISALPESLIGLSNFCGCCQLSVG